MTLEEIRFMLDLLNSKDTEMKDLGLTVFNSHFPHLKTTDNWYHAVAYLVWKNEQIIDGYD